MYMLYMYILCIWKTSLRGLFLSLSLSLSLSVYVPPTYEVQPQIRRHYLIFLVLEIRIRTTKGQRNEKGTMFFVGLDD